MSQGIPVRMRTTPEVCLFGYLTTSEPIHDGDLVKYNLTFRMAALHEPPRFDVRLYPEEASNGF